MSIVKMTRNSLKKKMSTSPYAFTFIFIIIILSTSSLVSFVDITPASPVKGNSGAKPIPFNSSAEVNYKLQTTTLNTSIFKILKDVHSQDPSFIVGARNFVFRLSGNDLSVTDFAHVGPVIDNQNCRPSPDKCTASGDRTDQDNKVIMIDYNTKPHPTIFSCGSTKQGMCFLHKYNKLQDGGYFGSPGDSVNYIASRKNTVGFMVPTSNGTAFIIGHEYDKRNISFAPPVLSSRVLQIANSRPPAFQYTHQGENSNSSLDIHPKFKESYSLQFVYGFHYKEFAYFVTNQPASITSSYFETRLGRVCLRDTSFVSYTEIPIQCASSKTGSYLYSTAASLGQSGQKQYRILNSTSDSPDTLFVSFMKTTRRESINMPEGSVVCGFNMKSIDQKFFDAIDKCFSGDSNTRRLEVFAGSSRKCIKPSFSRNINQLLCGQSAYNHYIEGRDPLVAKPLLIWKNSKITSLVTDVLRHDTIVLMGNDRGNFSKAVLPSDENKLGEIVYNELMNIKESQRGKVIPSDEYEIRKDPVLSKEGKNTFVYFASGNQVTKFPVNSCSIYSTCRTCFESEDPLNCGWCGSHCASSR